MSVKTKLLEKSIWVNRFYKKRFPNYWIFQKCSDFAEIWYDEFFLGVDMMLQSKRSPMFLRLHDNSHLTTLQVYQPINSNTSKIWDQVFSYHQNNCVQNFGHCQKCSDLITDFSPKFGSFIHIYIQNLGYSQKCSEFAHI